MRCNISKNRESLSLRGTLHFNKWAVIMFRLCLGGTEVVPGSQKLLVAFLRRPSLSLAIFSELALTTFPAEQVIYIQQPRSCHHVNEASPVLTWCIKILFKCFHHYISSLKQSLSYSTYFTWWVLQLSSAKKQFLSASVITRLSVQNQFYFYMGYSLGIGTCIWTFYN